MTTRIAIIGAGLAGLTLAHRLQSKGQLKVAVFEKADIVGGRLSSVQSGGFAFDHGAQYFTIRGDGFREFLEPALQQGIVVPWDPHIVILEKGRAAIPEPRDETIYVAAPGMGALCAHLCEGVSVATGTEIVSCMRKNNAWNLLTTTVGSLGPFDWVVSATPPQQCRSWLPGSFVKSIAFDHVRLRGCFSLMLGFEEASPVNWQGAFVRNSPIGWMAVNSHKHGRKGGPTLLVQCDGVWADEHMEDEPEPVEAMLCGELQSLTGIDSTHAKHRALYRWRYAGTAEPFGENYLLDTQSQLAVCGDWCIKGRVEAAFTSADTLAARLLAVLPQ